FHAGDGGLWMRAGLGAGLVSHDRREGPAPALIPNDTGEEAPPIVIWNDPRPALVADRNQAVGSAQVNPHDDLGVGHQSTMTVSRDQTWRGVACQYGPNLVEVTAFVAACAPGCCICRSVAGFLRTGDAAPAERKHAGPLGSPADPWSDDET